MRGIEAVRHRTLFRRSRTVWRWTAGGASRRDDSCASEARVRPWSFDVRPFIVGAEDDEEEGTEIFAREAPDGGATTVRPLTAGAGAEAAWGLTMCLVEALIEVMVCCFLLYCEDIIT